MSPSTFAMYVLAVGGVTAMALLLVAVYYVCKAIKSAFERDDGDDQVGFIVILVFTVVAFFGSVIGTYAAFFAATNS